MLRIGILGAAKIAPPALVRPARAVAEVEVTAVAARDPGRADAFARKHGIPRTLASYQAVLDDPDVDAVYNPLPNGLHAEWTLKALAAGKHVLCEKPFTANAAQARTVAEAAKAAGLVVMEAFHYRYHPLAERMRSIAHSGELGTIRSVSASLCFPLPKFSDIRYDYSLAGGAMMDAGVYPLTCLRLLGPSEPHVVTARAKLRSPQVDRAMSVELGYEGGATGHLEASMWSSKLLQIRARVKGDRGELKVFNFVAPHLRNRLTLTVDGRTTRERVPGDPTYTYQLRAFAGAVLRGEPFPTTPEDAVQTMSLVDDIYTAAGLPLRGV
ncbi:MAG: oxidoreductase [Frankiales bacterium]|nr:oxidoreductase [Frankiales bacterium]